MDWITRHGDCIAHGRCSAEPTGCAARCAWYIRLMYHWQESGIPVHYRGAWWRRWEPGPRNLGLVQVVGEWVADLSRFVEAGYTVYIHPGQRDSSGGTGIGKTYLAAMLALEYLFQRVKVTREPEIQWWSVPDVLQRLRDTFETPDGDFRRRWRRSATVPLLILDDIGAEKPSEWVQEQLTWLINERVTRDATTILTSNYSLVELEQRLGSRLVSRLHERLVDVPLYGADRRRARVGEQR